MKFEARWKANGEVFNCETEGDDIKFGRGDEPKWRRMPEKDFWRFHELSENSGQLTRQGGLFDE